MKTALAVATTAAIALITAPAAHAGATLAVGMPISIGENRCSLGFFAFDANHDRPAVTSGHCADDNNQTVYTNAGTPIGFVASHLADDAIARKSVRPRGFTLIKRYGWFTIEPVFTGIADAHTGDAIAKFWERTGKTSGHITNTYYTDGDDPATETLLADEVILPGDSGKPLVQQRPDPGRHLRQRRLRPWRRGRRRHPSPADLVGNPPHQRALTQMRAESS